jgi:hypothetical protein
VTSFDGKKFGLLLCETPVKNAQYPRTLLTRRIATKIGSALTFADFSARIALRPLQLHRSDNTYTVTSIWPDYPADSPRVAEAYFGRSQKSMIRDRRVNGRRSCVHCVRKCTVIRRALMKLFIFRSGTNASLRAFAGDLDGSRLPSQFRPWHAIGSLGADGDPPHQLSRKRIENAIDDQGFQLWRLKPRAKST